MTSLQPSDAAVPAPVSEASTLPHRTFLHPASGALILGLDWLLWSGTVATGGAAAAVTGVAGLALGGTGVGLVQRHLAKDSPRAAFVKGVIAGVIVGAPFPIAGTVVGATVLALSGLNRFAKHRVPAQ